MWLGILEFAEFLINLTRFDFHHTLQIYLTKNNLIEITDTSNNPRKFFIRINKIVFVPTNDLVNYKVYKYDSLGKASHYVGITSQGSLRLPDSISSKIKLNSDTSAIYNYKYVDFFCQVSKGKMYVLRYKLDNESIKRNEGLKSYLNVPIPLIRHRKLYHILQLCHILKKPSIYNKNHTDKEKINEHNRTAHSERIKSSLCSNTEELIGELRTDIITRLHGNIPVSTNDSAPTNDYLYDIVQIIDKINDLNKKTKIRKTIYSKIISIYNRHHLDKQVNDYDWPFNIHKKYSYWCPFAKNVISMYEHRHPYHTHTVFGEYLLKRHH